jgi:cystathionine gamma-synthase
MEKQEVTFYHILESSKVVGYFNYEKGFNKAKKYWQHSGEIVTSRQAEHLLRTLIDHHYIQINCFTNKTTKYQSSYEMLTNLLVLPSKELSFGLSIPSSLKTKELLSEWNLLKDDTFLDNDFDETSESASMKVKNRISTIINYQDNASLPNKTQISVNDIVLTPTGMAAIYSTFLMIRDLYSAAVTVTEEEIKPVFIVFGYPYLDTLKVMLRPEWNEGGGIFFGLGNDDDLLKLEEFLAKNQLPSSSSTSSIFKNHVAAIFAEFPTNPLLKCSNLLRLTELSKQYGILLVADDTIGNAANLNMFSSQSGVCADILCTSLTKLFNGASNTMAGNIILNPSAVHYSRLSNEFQTRKANHDFPLLPKYDAEVLEFNSRYWFYFFYFSCSLFYSDLVCCVAFHFFFSAFIDLSWFVRI